jgi:hypothetical protein
VAGSPYTTDRPLFDNSKALPNFTNDPIFTGPPATAQALVIFGGDGIADGTVRSWGRSVTTRGPDNLPVGLSPYNSFDRFTRSLYGAANPVPYDVNVYGNAMPVRMNADQWHAIVEQKLARNLYLEGAWYHERYGWDLFDAGTAGGFIYMDPNLFLPDGVTPNPNVGKCYVQRGGANQRNNVQRDRRNDYRVSLSYELDLRNRFGWVGRWLLGNLRPAIMFEQDNTETTYQVFYRSILDNPTLSGTSVSPFTTGSVGTGTVGTGTRNWATTNNNRAFTPRFYLGGPAGYAANFPYDVFAPVWRFNDANGNPFGVYSTWTPWTSVEGYPLVSGAVPTGSLQKTNTMMFALQDSVLCDRLVLLYGYRRDSAKSAALDRKYQTIDWSGLVSSYTVARYGSWGDTQTGATTTAGIVARLFPSVSALYNHSNTFQPNPGQRDPFGNQLKGERGKGEDAGLNISLFRERLQARVTRYETKTDPSIAGAYQDPIRGNLLTMETNLAQFDPSMTILNGDKGGFPTLGTQSYRVTSNRRSEGYEAQLSWRPTPNWDVVVNGSKCTAVQKDIGATFIDWINARLPVWQAATTTVNGAKVKVWDTQPYNLNANAMTFAQYYQTVIRDQVLATWEAANNTSEQSRKYGTNPMAKYRFTEGLLKSMSANVAFRYRSGATIGYATKTGSSDVLLLDSTRQIMGPSTLLTDLGLSYGGRIKAFADLRYRVQMNVRNLFNEWTIVPVKALTTGESGRWQRLPPRTYVLSCSFEI